MRIPVSVMRGLKVGIGGTTLALAVGCSKAPTADKDPAPTPTVAYETADSQTDASRSSSTRPGSATTRDPRTAPRDDSARDDSARDDRQVPSNAWFLQPPGSPSPNEPAKVQSTDPQPPVAVETQTKPKPVVAKPVPTPPRPHWNIHAACGRG